MKKLMLFVVVFGLILNNYGSFTDIAVSSTGSYLNSGGSTNDSPDFTFSGGSWDGSGKVYSISGADLSGVSTNILISLYLDSVTNKTSFIGMITKVDDSLDTITLSSNAFAGFFPSSSDTNMTVRIGGALKGPDANEWFPFDFITANLTNAFGHEPCVNIKGSYTITKGLTNSIPGPIWWIGYTNMFRDGGRALITGRTNEAPFIMFAFSGIRHSFIDLDIERNGYWPSTTTTGNYMWNMTGTGYKYYRMRFRYSFRSSLRVAGAGAQVISSVADECNVNAGSGFGGFDVIRSSYWRNCWSINSKYLNSSDCDALRINVTSSDTVVFQDCIFADNLGRGAVCSSSNFQILFINCVFANNNKDGIWLTSSASSVPRSSVLIQNSLFWNNNGYDIRVNHPTWGPNVENCAFGDSANGDFYQGNTNLIVGKISVINNPFIDDSAGNYGLNTDTNGGGLLRNAGVGVFLSSTNYTSHTSSFPNVGSVQD